MVLDISENRGSGRRDWGLGEKKKAADLIGPTAKNPALLAHQAERFMAL
jgi:hypothetical protein